MAYKYNHRCQDSADTSPTLIIVTHQHQHCTGSSTLSITKHTNTAAFITIATMCTINSARVPAASKTEAVQAPVDPEIVLCVCECRCHNPVEYEGGNLCEYCNENHNIYAK
ncbi:hypothetical protein ACJ41O_015022 [Fusarium nematophilum]